MPARQKPLAAAMQTLTMSDSARNVSPLAQLVRGPASAAHSRVALQLRAKPVLQARGALSRCAQLLGVILHDHERSRVLRPAQRQHRKVRYVRGDPQLARFEFERRLRARSRGRRRRRPHP